MNRVHSQNRFTNHFFLQRMTHIKKNLKIFLKITSWYLIKSCSKLKITSAIHVKIKSQIHSVTYSRSYLSDLRFILVRPPIHTCQGSNSYLSRKRVSRLIKILFLYRFCVIWRHSHPTLCPRFTSLIVMIVSFQVTIDQLLNNEPFDVIRYHQRSNDKFVLGFVKFNILLWSSLIFYFCVNIINLGQIEGIHIVYLIDDGVLLDLLVLFLIYK